MRNPFKRQPVKYSEDIEFMNTMSNLARQADWEILVFERETVDGKKLVTSHYRGIEPHMVVHVLEAILTDYRRRYPEGESHA